MTRTLTYDRSKVIGLYDTNKMFFSLSGPNLKRDKQPYIYFQRSTFVGSAWSFGFFIPATMANDLWL